MKTEPSVDFSEYFNASIFRHLTMFGSDKCEVFELPSIETFELKNKLNFEDLATKDFSIKQGDRVFNFKLMINKNSHSSSLLSQEFLNNLIWAVDSRQDFSERNHPVLNNSFNHAYLVERDGGKNSEVIYLNVSCSSMPSMWDRITKFVRRIFSRKFF